MAVRPTFGVDSTCSPEQDISVVGPDGVRTLQPGKVDAFRYMTFDLAPRSDHHDLFFNQVVDPIWLAQSNDPGAAPRHLRQPGAGAGGHGTGDATGAGPAVARHPEQPPIKTLEPFVRDKAARYVDFATAVRRAVAMYLPDLQPHVDRILAYLVLYYGVSDAPQLAA